VLGFFALTKSYAGFVRRCFFTFRILLGDAVGHQPILEFESSGCQQASFLGVDALLLAQFRTLIRIRVCCNLRLFLQVLFDKKPFLLSMSFVVNHVLELAMLKARIGISR